MRERAAVAVVKVGGSVLTGASGYREVAASLARQSAAGDTSLVVVVSAEHGHTDALLLEARIAVEEPDAAALDLLWSTGELRSVALLTLYLQAAGVAARGLNVHETGLRLPAGVRPGPGHVELNPIRLHAALSLSPIVVVPGFVVTRQQQVVTLGRGGSDWSAVILAVALEAERCELVKDVPGYFTDDPNANPDASPIAHLTYGAAIDLADAGCPLVQRQAIAEAARAGLPLVVRSLEGAGTVISEPARGSRTVPGPDSAILRSIARFPDRPMRSPDIPIALTNHPISR